MDSPTAAATQPGPLEFTRRRLSIDANVSHYYIYVGLAGGQRERARERANCGLQGATVTRSIFRRNSLDSGSVSKAGPRRQPGQYQAAPARRRFRRAVATGAAASTGEPDRA